MHDRVYLRNNGQNGLWRIHVGNQFQVLKKWWTDVLCYTDSSVAFRELLSIIRFCVHLLIADKNLLYQTERKGYVVKHNFVN